MCWGWLVQEEVTWQNSHECWPRMKKIKKSCFSEPEDSLHDFPTVGVMSFQAEILLTIHMEIEGSRRSRFSHKLDLSMNAVLCLP